MGQWNPYESQWEADFDQLESTGPNWKQTGDVRAYRVQVWCLEDPAKGSLEGKDSRGPSGFRWNGADASLNPDN